MTKATDPRNLAVWTLPDLAERVQQWADEEYETIRHPALGMTPRQAYERSIERDGLRAHKQILYDETFRMATFPTTRKGTAKVVPGVGVRINHLDYWCEAMRDPMVENRQSMCATTPLTSALGMPTLITSGGSVTAQTRSSPDVRNVNCNCLRKN